MEEAAHDLEKFMDYDEVKMMKTWLRSQGCGGDKQDSDED